MGGTRQPGRAPVSLPGDAGVGSRLDSVDQKRMYRDNGNMNREHVIARLRGYESELRAAGIIRLSLFGSTARGDERPDSDIDLLAAFDDTRRISLLDVVGMEERISRFAGPNGRACRGGYAETAGAEERRGRGGSCLLEIPSSASRISLKTSSSSKSLQVEWTSTRTWKT
jgi:predicted nucleotidyltransferase